MKTYNPLKLLASIPDKVMDWYAKKHSNVGSFKSMYKGTYFIALILLCVIAVMATRVDYTVMSSIIKVSTGDDNVAFGVGISIALMIQAFVLISGGIVIKILINGLYRQKAHISQLIIHGLLLVAGFGTTFYLSSQTYFSAKANAESNKTKLLENISQITDNHSDAKEERVNALSSYFDGREDKINSLYDNKIKHEKQDWDVSVAKYDNRLSHGKITKEYHSDKVAAYNISYSKKIKKLEYERSEKLEEIHNQLSSKVQGVDSKYSFLWQNNYDNSHKEKKDLEKAIEQNANITMYWNIFLNVASFLLCVGLLLYAKGATQKPEKATQEPTQDELDEDWVDKQNAKMAKKRKESTSPTANVSKKKALHKGIESLN